MLASELILLGAFALYCQPCFSSQPCKVWFTHNNSADTCECGSNLDGLVHCDTDTGKVSLLFCYCMTYNDRLNQTLVGPCLQMCRTMETPKCYSLNMIMAKDENLLNDEMCGAWKRTGQLCGRCSPGYALPVYSYTLKCVNCSREDFVRNLFKYIAVAYLPLTAVFFFVITFKISVTSGNMVAYILACQTLTMPTLLRAITIGDQNHFILSWFTTWNLDSLRLAYPPFCLHPDMTTLHILVLDYLIGIYPLILIILTHTAVLLHNRYPIVVKLWRPVYRVFMCVRREWDIHGSLVQAFSTFLILSYVKILNVSFDLLTPVTLKTVNGEKLNQTYLYINGEILFFGSEHLPYGILAIVMSTVFNAIPMLFLMLYPSQCFRKCLSRCRVKNKTLYQIMDAFQGCYLCQPRDCRFVAGFYLFLRILFLSAATLIHDPAYFPVLGFFCIAVTVLINYLEPYKEKKHNKLDMFIFLLLGSLAFVGGLYVYIHSAEPQIKVTPILVCIITPMSLVAILYGIIIILRTILPKKLYVWGMRCYRVIRYRILTVKSEDETVHDRLEDERVPLLDT